MGRGEIQDANTVWRMNMRRMNTGNVGCQVRDRTIAMEDRQEDEVFRRYPKTSW